MKEIIDMEEIREKYFEELKNEIEKKGIKIPTPTSLFVTDSEISFLERFAEINKLVDTKKIWKKYEKEYNKLLKREIKEFIKIIRGFK